MKTRRLLMITACSLALVAACFAEQADWPVWRGPDHDGTAQETDWSVAGLTNGPTIVWQKNVGTGYSCVSIAGPHLFTMGNMNNTDTVYCVAADTGAPVWKYSYPCPEGSHPGPRATPVYDNGLLYVLSREGDLVCLDAANGAVVWQKNIARLYDARKPRWGLSSSPLIAGDMVVVNVNVHGMAFDKRSGDLLWTSPAGQGGYASPVRATLDGKPVLLLFGEEALFGVEPSSGKQLWSFSWIFRNRVNAADPIAIGNNVFISSGYGKGCALVSITDGVTTALWQNTEMKNQFGTSILIDGYLYGPDGNAGNADLVCMNAKDGAVAWRQKSGFSSLTMANGILIVLNESGELMFVKATPEKYEEIARCTVLDDKSARCWTMPVLCRGLLYCRNSKGALVCVDLKK